MKSPEDEENSLCDHHQSLPPTLTLMADNGYGWPREKSVRNEKIRAVARQLTNFIVQYASACSVRLVVTDTVDVLKQRICTLVSKEQEGSAIVWVDDTDDDAVEDTKAPQKNKETTETGLAVHFTRLSVRQWLEREEIMSCSVKSDDAESSTAGLPRHCYYLSPDADQVLDLCKLHRERSTTRTTTTQSSLNNLYLIIGMIIDRRVQKDRSLCKAQATGLPARRLALNSYDNNYHPHEPLNVDCCLDMVATWWRREGTHNDVDDNVDDNDHWRIAVRAALRRHEQRHPVRARHL